MDVSHTILLVEDEKEPAEMLANFLEMHDYQVLVAHDGKKAMELIHEHAEEINLAVLDIMVPYIDGKELCSNIREHPILHDIPVIFLTAKDQEKDEIEGLELGADDYISKPMSLKLVKARIETLLRRRRPETKRWLHFGNVYLDTVSKEVYRDEEPVELTSTEFQLLEMIFRNPARVFTRQEILERISGDDKYVFDRTVDVHVKNIRLKLEEDGSVIKTYRGVGYGLSKELRGG
ncbi:MAG: response regulator transcription factor [Bacteroidota bacterium]